MKKFYPEPYAEVMIFSFDVLAASGGEDGETEMDEVLQP